MTDNKHQIDGIEPKYYARIPNIAVDELDYAELALYMYYKRIASDKGMCWKSTAQAAEDIGMSLAKIRKTRDSLEIKGYIAITDRKNANGIECNSKLISIVNIWEYNINQYTDPLSKTIDPPIENDRPPLSKTIDKEKPLRKTLKESISPSGETSKNTLSVEEADNTLFGTREEPVTPDAELLKPKFTTDQLKELANAYVNGYCPVGKYNRPICLDLLTSGYFKVRGRNTEGVTSYKLSATGKAVCSDPSTPLLDIIKQKQETQATIVARKEAAKDKPKKKKNGSKTPIDLSTRPEIEPIVQALCQIHFNSKYQDATDVNKQTLISLANIYRNQGADTAAKVHQIHDHYRKEDWYKGASPFGFTQKMRIMQALSNNSKNQPADKISKFNE